MGEGLPYQVPGWTLEPIILARCTGAPFVSPFLAAQSLVPEGGPSKLGTGVGQPTTGRGAGSRPPGFVRSFRRPQGCPCVILSLSLSPLPSNELLPAILFLATSCFISQGKFQRVGLTTPFNGGKHDNHSHFTEEERKPRDARGAQTPDRAGIGLQIPCSLGV